MSTFEIIILGIIYLFAYGYVLSQFTDNNKEDDSLLAILTILISLIFAFYAPIFLAMDINNYLNKHGRKDI